MEILLIGSQTIEPQVNLVPENVSDFVRLQAFKVRFNEQIGELEWSAEIHSIGSTLALGINTIACISLKIPICGKVLRVINDEQGDEQGQAH